MSLLTPDINKPLHELLPLFYEKYTLEMDGGHHDNKVKINFTSKLYFYFPNSESRRKALLKHDVHHIITGYRSDMIGETEIGSWEIASGCNDYWAAWALDFYAMSWGLWLNPKGIFRAFVRGRRSKNLYGNHITDEQALKMTLTEIQKLLSLPAIDQAIQPDAKDYFSFLFWLSFSGIFGILSIILLPLIILYNALIFTQKFFWRKY